MLYMLCDHDPRNRRDAMRIDAIKVYLDTKPAARLSRQRKGPIYQTGFLFETAKIRHKDIIRQWHMLFHNGMYGVKQQTMTKSVICHRTRRDTDWTK